MEALPEDVSPALEPLLARVTHTRSGVPYVRLGDVDVAWHPSFRLYLQTRLTNPNYRPEVAAQAVVVDFSVTRDGLEDQARTCGSGGGGGGGGGEGEGGPLRPGPAKPPSMARPPLPSL